MQSLLEMIEATAAVACDERLPPRVRLAAADEVMMWAGPLLVRYALSFHMGVWAGCVHGPDGECMCDEWESLIRLHRKQDR